jgi:hypothetical protein
VSVTNGIKATALSDLLKELRIILMSDSNSVLPQISAIVMDLGILRSILKAFDTTKDPQTGVIATNPIITEFILRHYATSQTMAIRRQTQNRTDVYSLRRILTEIESNHALFTRENICAEARIELDINVTIAKYDKFIRELLGNGVESWSTPESLDVDKTQWIHRMIDQISGVSEAHRSSGDCLNTIWLKSKSDQLKHASNRVVIHSHKFLAHAATLEDRIESGLPKWNETYNDITDALREIVRITIDIYKLIYLGGGVGFVPVLPEYMLSNLNAPIGYLSPEEFKTIWDELSNEVSTWIP